MVPVATILIADESAASREFLRTLLSHRGHRLLQATSGAQALKIALAERPDAVIADVGSDRLDGFELAKRIHESAKLANTVVIFQSVLGKAPSIETRAQDCGVRFVMPKPCEARVVLETLEHALGAKGAFTAPDARRERDQLQRLSDRLYETASALDRAQHLANLAHIITGPDGTFETWSETLPQLAGIAHDDVPLDTREWLRLVHADDRAFFRATCIEAGAQHRLKQIDYRLRRADGRTIHIRQTMEPLDQHAQGRWFNTLQDLTQPASLARDAPSMVEPSSDPDRLRKQTALDSLSRRERQVLQLIAEGRSVPAAGKLLSLSPRTVETYRARLYKKLHLKDMRALIVFALKQGIIFER